MKKEREKKLFADFFKKRISFQTYYVDTTNTAQSLQALLTQRLILE